MKLNLRRGKVVNLIGKAEKVQTAAFDKNLQSIDLFLACDDKIANSLLSDLTCDIAFQ